MMTHDRNGNQFEGENRAPQPQPTKSGWYYAKYGVVSHLTLETNPVYLHILVNGKTRVNHHIWDQASNYTWFGPVLDVQHVDLPNSKRYFRPGQLEEYLRTSEFRLPTNIEPTSTGWWYGSWRGLRPSGNFIVEPLYVRVYRNKSPSYIQNFGRGNMKGMDWFGKVPEVRTE